MAQVSYRMARLAERSSRARLMSMLVMHAQQVSPVVVAVRLPHDGVDVEFFRLLVGEVDAGMMVELDHHNRALDAVVERIVLAGAADPAEMRFVEVALDFVHARRERTGRH